MEITQTIKGPLVTEKSTRLLTEGVYTFVVDRRATKTQIAEAVAKVFQVKVAKVRTAVMPGAPAPLRGRGRVGTRVRKGGSWKKAMVTLGEGEKIDVWEVS
jgi:large subunit ribosomal protein L23